jgi:hypothetical protein
LIRASGAAFTQKTMLIQPQPPERMREAFTSRSLRHPRFLGEQLSIHNQRDRI